uniref:Uncharacterized protein n=1 Tax=Arundo donax TaxID=35708 RepID=A0A0A9H8I6_ARUDO
MISLKLHLPVLMSQKKSHVLFLIYKRNVDVFYLYYFALF